ncbi:MAG: DUF2007 domain-containing protein [Candidatus Limimorpha sp.]
MEKTIACVYTGSDIDANYIAALLKNENIDCFVRNSYSQSISVGWVDGYQTQSTEVSVNQYDFDAAKKIVDNYLNSLK